MRKRTPSDDGEAEVHVTAIIRRRHKEYLDERNLREGIKIKFMMQEALDDLIQKKPVKRRLQ